MDVDKFKEKAQQVYTERGGSDAAKEDGSELKDIFAGDGSLADKAKAAAEALKDPGAEGDQADGTPPPAGSPPASELAAAQPRI